MQLRLTYLLRFAGEKGQKSISLKFVYTRFDRVALEFLSLLRTFENSAKCSKMSFDSGSFQNIAKRSFLGKCWKMLEKLG